ncbi:MULTISPECIES: helix-turn-helix domain-containing protein [Gordonibacter]|uniref:Helix-turn-helix transcriptional regulator n=1 Tax=Gordonibacter faecis TaxID=3047475 RepID=A0ABT7DKT2_9ACTN|nr:helix-turn-helix transcriptional regulator [Gordonibacter sp. KGMB12511]MDJ1649862.1 helix-turn-helix transcriptional regulator [Gordonibacter sp. KGMB12511]
MKHIGLIAARMEQARWERGIGVAELARRVGVDRKRLWRVLNGERVMRADEFLALCVALRIDPRSFVSRGMVREVAERSLPRRRGA